MSGGCMDDYDRCLQNGRLKTVEIDDAAIHDGLLTALQELRDGIGARDARDWGQVVTAAYFSTMHAGQWAVRARGIRHTNLFSLIAALRRHFTNDETVTVDELRHLQLAKEAHELAQSGSRVSEQLAKEHLELASDVLYNVLATLALPGLDAEVVPRVTADD